MPPRPTLSATTSGWASPPASIVRNATSPAKATAAIATSPGSVASRQPPRRYSASIASAGARARRRRRGANSGAPAAAGAPARRRSTPSTQPAVGQLGEQRREARRALRPEPLLGGEQHATHRALAVQQPQQAHVRLVEPQRGAGPQVLQHPAPRPLPRLEALERVAGAQARHVRAADRRGGHRRRARGHDRRPPGVALVARALHRHLRVAEAQHRAVAQRDRAPARPPRRRPRSPSTIRRRRSPGLRRVPVTRACARETLGSDSRAADARCRPSVTPGAAVTRAPPGSTSSNAGRSPPPRSVPQLATPAGTAGDPPATRGADHRPTTAHRAAHGNRRSALDRSAVAMSRA